jgi:hypothetical protein
MDLGQPTNTNFINIPVTTQKSLNKRVTILSTKKKEWSLLFYKIFFSQKLYWRSKVKCRMSQRRTYYVGKEEKRCTRVRSHNFSIFYSFKYSYIYYQGLNWDCAVKSRIILFISKYVFWFVFINEDDVVIFCFCMIEFEVSYLFFLMMCLFQISLIDFWKWKDRKYVF